MKNDTPLIVTISRQLGSGGAYVGQQLAKKLGIFYVDREIITKAAEQISVMEEDLESRDEKIPTFWRAFLQASVFIPDIYVPPKMMITTDRELYEAEADVIERIAKERSAVIIGRCGFHILRNYPCHVSVFLHGNQDFRIGRVQKLYSLDKDAATKMVVTNDKERALYYKSFTGRDWKNVRNYDIAIDTSRLGDMDKAVDIIYSYLGTK